MSANEKLGISIEINEVTVAGNIQTDINAKVSGIKVDPVKVGVTAGDMSQVIESLKGIAAQFKALSGASDVATAGFKATKKEIQNFADAFTKGDLDKAKDKMEELYDTKKMKQWSKEYQSELATIMKQQEAGQEASRKGIEANAKAAKAALNTQINNGTANLAIYRNSGLQPVNGGFVNASVNTKQSVEEAHAAALKILETQNAAEIRLRDARAAAALKVMEAQDKETAKTAKAIADKLKAEDDFLSKQIRNQEKLQEEKRRFNAAMDREDAASAAKAKANIEKLQAIQAQRDWKGYQSVDGGKGFVRSSVITDVGDAHTAALRLNNALNSTSKLDPFKDMFKGMPVATTTIAELQNRLQGLHKDLSKLDGQSFSQVNSQLRRYKAELDLSSGSVKELSAHTTILGVTLSKMATRLAEFYSLRTVIFAVGSQFREATSAAIDLNQATHDILAISGESKDQFKAVSDSIYDIAKASRFTTQEVAGLMQVLAQAGVKSKDLSEVSKQTGMFATATASDPKLAADLVTTSMNVFAIDAQNVTRSTNAMAAALNLSKLETAGLGTAFNYLAPQAAQLGMTMEQTLAIISNMAQSGIKASTIGTGVSQMLKEFSTPKPRLRKMLDEVGLSPDDINPMKKNFADIVQTLQDKGVTVDQLFQAMETRVGRAAVTAVNLSANSFREMEANLTGTHAALVAYDKTMEGAKARINVTKQSFQELATIIGNQLAPAFIWVNGAIQDFIKIMSSDDGSVTKLALQFTLATGAIGLFTIAYKGLMATAIGSASFGAIAGIFTGLRASIAGLPALVGGISVAFNTFIGGAAPLATAAAAISAAFKAMWVSIGGLPGLIAVGIITAVTAATYLVVDALGAERREKEALNKATLEKIDAEERQLRNANAIINSTREGSKAYAAYTQARKEGIAHEEALKLVTDKTTVATNEQMAVLNKYVREGGPAAQKIQWMMREGDQLRAMIELTRELNQAEAVRTLNAVNTYNKTRKEVADPNAIFSSLANASGGDVQARSKKISELRESYLAGDTKTLELFNKEVRKREEARLKSDATYNASANIASKATAITIDAPVEKRDKNNKVIKDVAGNPVYQTDKNGNTLIVPRINSIQANTSGGYDVVQQAVLNRPNSASAKPESSGVSSASRAPQFKDTNDVIGILKAERATLLKSLEEQGTSAGEIRAKVEEVRIKEGALQAALEKKEIDEVDRNTWHQTQIKDKKGKITSGPTKWNAGVNKQITDRLEQDKITGDTRLAERLSVSGVDISRALYEVMVEDAKNKAAAEVKQLAETTTVTSEQKLKIRSDAEKAFTDEVFKIVQDEQKRLSDLEKSALNEMIGSAYTEEKTRQDLVNAAKTEARKDAWRELETEVTKLTDSAAAKRAEKGADFQTIENTLQEGLKSAQGKYDRKILDAGAAIDKSATTGAIATLERTATLEREARERSKDSIYDAEKLKNITIAQYDADLALSTAKEAAYKAEASAITIAEGATELSKEQVREQLRLNGLAEDELNTRIKIADARAKASEGIFDSFKRGAGEAWRTQTDFNAQANQAGGNLVNNATNGFAETISGTFGFSAEKEESKAKIKEEISKLNVQKAELEGSIASASAGSFRTPEQAAALAQQRIALQGVNEQLSEQQKNLRGLQGSWSSFADGLKKLMVKILEELQNYIVKMLVVAAVQKLIGLAMSSTGGGETDYSKGWEDSVTKSSQSFNFGSQAATPLKIFGDGGYIPLNAGKAGVDSVPALLMPGEVIIKKSSVDYYGANNLLDINDKKIQRFAEGGWVGGGTRGTGNTSNDKEIILNIINVADPSQIPAKPANAQEIVNIVGYDLANRGVLHKQIRAVMAG